VHCETVNLRQALVSSGAVETFVLLMEKCTIRDNADLELFALVKIGFPYLPRVVG
jgi:hypothetical protein